MDATECASPINQNIDRLAFQSGPGFSNIYTEQFNDDGNVGNGILLKDDYSVPKDPFQKEGIRCFSSRIRQF